MAGCIWRIGERFMAAVNHENFAELTGNDRVAQAIREQNFQLTDGPVTLKPVPNLIRLPLDHERRVIDYHAIARDNQGRIYVLYNSNQRAADTRALARFHYEGDSPGQERIIFDTFLGARDWADGTPHGLNISRCRNTDGLVEELMAIVNNDGTIILADLDGRERWRHAPSPDGPKAPTSAVAAIDADSVAVVDGYATNSNFLFSKLSARIVNKTGSEGCDDGQSKTNHGIDLDPDGHFVIADRGNTRLTWWTAESLVPLMYGQRQVTLDMRGLQVCNTSFLGRYAVVPCLNSKLAFLAPDGGTTSGYRVAAVITMPHELIAAGIDGIHDAEFTPDGRFIIVAVWERHRTERQIPTLTAFRLFWNELHMGNIN
jgi:hypothetical protein